MTHLFGLAIVPELLVVDERLDLLFLLVLPNMYNVVILSYITKTATGLPADAELITTTVVPVPYVAFAVSTYYFSSDSL